MPSFVIATYVIRKLTRKGVKLIPSVTISSKKFLCKRKFVLRFWHLDKYSCSFIPFALAGDLAEY